MRNAKYDIIIIGAGAAGMMAACTAAEAGARVLLLEKNEKPGKKIYITGKGRCNFTNACDPETFLQNVPRNAAFLYSALYGFDSDAAISWFEAHGMRTKVERGQRAFPASDHASDVTKALTEAMRKAGVEIRLNTEVRSLILSDEMTDDRAYTFHEDGTVDTPSDDHAAPAAYKNSVSGMESVPKSESDEASGQDSSAPHAIWQKQKVPGIKGGTSSGIKGVTLKNGEKIPAKCVIIATGGLSYPTTGSTGDGFRFAEKAGHKVTPLTPSLVPLLTAETDIPQLQGLSLKNVKLTIRSGKKKCFDAFGEMMFTHFGITGPLILSASAMIQDAVRKGPLAASIDLKPALSAEKLDARILREFEESRNKSFRNAVAPLFPSKLIPVMIRRTGIDPDKPVHDITKEERARLIAETKQFEMTITGLRGFQEAVITRGGVSVKEIDPAAMESKIVKGLYFAGEVIDVDALTGGFNLQIAWATGYAAGHAAAESAALTDGG